MNHIADIVKKLDYFPTPDVEQRRECLKKLFDTIKDMEEEIFRALYEDLGKSKFEACATETSIVLEDIAMMIKKLPLWGTPRRVPVSSLNWPARGSIRPEPYGKVLIFSAWNYPFQLMLSPLVGAVAAGNRVVAKPAEQAAATSFVIEKLITKVFDPSHVVEIRGGVDVATDLLNETFDYIFYTGGEAGGKAVARAAAEKLTPVTLELGGKSPCIVDADADLDLSAKRIVWGKFLNAGQTCVAPDYLYVHASIKDALLDRIRFHLCKFYGEDPIRSKDYPQIINERHFDRLLDLLDGRKTDHSREKRFIAPTVIDNVSPSDKLMREEIFGPLLPVMSFKDLDEVISFVNARPKPLALYYYSSGKKSLEKLLSETSSGSVCVNECITQLINSSMPFGGVGASGMGAYHGKYTFDTFTHYKPVMEKATWLDLPMRYPPNLDKRFKLLKFLTK